LNTAFGNGALEIILQEAGAQLLAITR
jgi:hypothetical protein